MTDLYLRDLMPIVELQALELRRLMRDKERLNQRIDTLVDELGELRALQQQDQTWREREQDLRSRLQKTLGDLLQRSDLTAAVPARAKDVAAPGMKVVKSEKPGAGEGSKAREPLQPSSSPAARAERAPRPKVTTGGIAADPAAKRTADPSDFERMEIPLFLAEGPRVGFDSKTAGDIRSIHGPSKAGGEAPIKRLLDRIRARNSVR